MHETRHGSPKLGEGLACMPLGIFLGLPWRVLVALGLIWWFDGGSLGGSLLTILVILLWTVTGSLILLLQLYWWHQWLVHVFPSRSRLILWLVCYWTAILLLGWGLHHAPKALGSGIAPLSCSFSYCGLPMRGPANASNLLGKWTLPGIGIVRPISSCIPIFHLFVGERLWIGFVSLLAFAWLLF